MPTAKRRNIPDSVLEKAAVVPREPVEALWELWKGVHASTKGRKRILSDRCIQDVSVALVTFGLDACARAIIGAHFSPWHMGDNPAGKRYTSIQLILRYGEAWRVTKFIKLYSENSDDAKELREKHGTLVDAILYPNPTVVEEVAEVK